MTLGVRRSLGAGALDAIALAGASRAALDVPIEDDAELWIAEPTSEAIWIGAFQRATEIDVRERVARRGSGGPAVRIGVGSVWVALVLSRVGALVECDEARIVNRHVRPILRALTKCGALAHYFGRDSIAVKHRPVAWIGFAHERASGRCVVEAVIARETRFDVGEKDYGGKDPTTLAALLTKRVEATDLGDAIVRAWSEASGHVAIDRGEIARVASAGDEESALRAEPPWDASLEEAIGPVCAGRDARGRFRVGGDLLVSRDALAALEDALPNARDEEVAALVDATLRAPGGAIEGVRSLESVAAVIAAARAAGRS